MTLMKSLHRYWKLLTAVLNGQADIHSTDILNGQADIHSTDILNGQADNDNILLETCGSLKYVWAVKIDIVYTI